ncbi:hypothetical protein BpHYR1_019884 [Brachionus plicatilis]|uniref:Uncharacterized protein n=1 Tax=Brachionus plicatilis TaxID=10195 RepID=A0A3M7T957_BRAPC|nr:hypothetical protein BpHYR1_019884 [Brachionus plicatilis]
MKYWIFLALVLLILTSDLTVGYHHPECGESPAIKYKTLAARIGWEWLELIKFMRNETPKEYDLLLNSVKQFADCITMSNIPLKK